MGDFISVAHFFFHAPLGISLHSILNKAFHPDGAKVSDELGHWGLQQIIKMGLGTQWILCVSVQPSMLGWLKDGR